jgi:hypothetical protein
MIPQYVIARVREALAQDPRTNLLDVQVRVLGAVVYLLGTVESADRRAAAEQVAREAMPEDVSLVNELWVDDYGGIPSREDLP